MNLKIAATKGLKVIYTLSIIILVFSQQWCINPKSKKSNIYNTAKANEIKQKDYFLTKEQTIDYIKQFKGISIDKENVAYIESIVVDSLAADSAVWALETILNFDFNDAISCQDDQSYTIEVLEEITGINKRTLKLNKMDLEIVYNSLAESIAAMVSSQHGIKDVDIMAVYEPGSDIITFKAVVERCFVKSRNVSSIISPQSSDFKKATQSRDYLVMNQ